jgi:hypothetical protein
MKVNFKKRPSDGSMKNIAFILDPDGNQTVGVTNYRLLD